MLERDSHRKARCDCWLGVKADQRERDENRRENRIKKDSAVAKPYKDGYIPSVDSRGRSTRRRSCEIRWLERRERNTEVGKDGEMRETWERKIHIGEDSKELQRVKERIYDTFERSSVNEGNSRGEMKKKMRERTRMMDGGKYAEGEMTSAERRRKEWKPRDESEGDSALSSEQWIMRGGQSESKRVKASQSGQACSDLAKDTTGRKCHANARLFCDAGEQERGRVRNKGVDRFNGAHVLLYSFHAACWKFPAGGGAAASETGSRSWDKGPARRGRGWRDWRRGDPTLIKGLWKSKGPLDSLGQAEIYIIVALLIGFFTVVIGCWLSDNCWSPEPEGVVTLA
ncbi:hypothetical protein ALC57_00778 [Trachymyrmex cornetzi]|uniref:Uncharacterized protein n=1 Tax=Trachymyrmex cornetzi TaxID=471704 RepID=A0A151JQX7_9HYME|nr:hypothetical protein ALC57_00778 [Trachymyrmex cornetzi]